MHLKPKKTKDKRGKTNKTKLEAVVLREEVKFSKGIYDGFEKHGDGLVL